MVPITASIGLSLSFFLLLVLAWKRPRLRRDRWLAAWLAAQLLFFGSFALAPLLLGTAAMLLAAAGQLAVFAFGPTQYCYAAAAYGRGRNPALHATILGPSIAALAVLLQFAEHDSPSGALVLRDVTGWWVFGPLVALIAAAAYPILVLRDIPRPRQRTSDADPHRSDSACGWIRSWAWSTLIFITLTAFALIGSVVFRWVPESYIAVVIGLQSVAIAYAGHRGIISRGVFVGETDKAQLLHPRPSIDIGQVKVDYEQLRHLLDADKPHRDSGLTAQMLADRLGWAPARLTTALRVGGDTTFFDAVNAARVRDLQALASIEENGKISILALAHDAGFGSKSALYEAFQRHVGSSPGHWRRSSRQP